MLTTTTNLDVPAPAAGADATRIRTEADAILADSRFARSKVLSRLLAYLVDQTLAGTAGSLKSCTIAIEGLGRQDAQSADDDAYARVAIGRLRRAIDEYYAQAPTRPFRLTIDRGSYEVGLMAVDTPRRTEAAVSPVGEEGERAKLYRRVFSGRWLGFLLVVVAIGIAMVLVSRQREAEQWRTPDFPLVHVEAPRNDEALAEFGHALAGALSRYNSLRVVSKPPAADGFRVELGRAKGPAGPRAQVQVVTGPSGRIVFTRDYPLADPPDVAAIGQLAIDVGGPLGAIHSLNRRARDNADTPYQCWLAFSGNLSSLSTVEDRRLNRCAANWYEADPDHPIAAAIYGWILVDQANRTPDDGSRRERLIEASRMLSSAIALNREVAALYLSSLRAHAVRQDGPAVAAAARDLLAAAPQNPVYTDYATMMLAFWATDAASIPPASPLANANSPFPPLIRTVRAVMADDPAGAAAQLTWLQNYEAKQPALRIFRAAILSRIGRVAEAGAVVRGFCRNSLITGFTPARIVGRMPIGPQLRARIWEWFRPLGGPDSPVMNCR